MTFLSTTLSHPKLIPHGDFSVSEIMRCPSGWRSGEAKMGFAGKAE